MAHICPAHGCKDTKGMCKHEKMMLGIGIVVILALLIWLVLF
jgi:hypothetical protein